MLAPEVFSSDYSNIYIHDMTTHEDGSLLLDLEDVNGSIIYQGATIAYSNSSSPLRDLAREALDGQKRISLIQITNDPYISSIKLDATESSEKNLMDQLSLLASFFVGILAITAFIWGLNWR